MWGPDGRRAGAPGEHAVEGGTSEVIWTLLQQEVSGGGLAVAAERLLGSAGSCQVDVGRRTEEGGDRPFC